MQDFSFDHFKEMNEKELKASISRHPEAINQIARELLYKKNQRNLPFYANKLIECITDEKIMQSEEVQELFSALQLNHFLGLNKNHLLSKAIKSENLVLASELIARGATLEKEYSSAEILDIMKTLLDSGPFHLFNACIDYLLEYHMEEFTAQNSELTNILEMAFNNPKLSDCKIVIKTTDSGEREIYINQKILSLPKNTMEIPPIIGTTFEVNVEDPQILIDLIRFCYGEKLEINEKNVHPLLEAAKKYHAPTLEHLCYEWIKTHPSKSQE